MRIMKERGKLPWAELRGSGEIMHYISRKFSVKYCALDEAAFAADKSLISAK